MQIHIYIYIYIYIYINADGTLVSWDVGMLGR